MATPLQPPAYVSPTRPAPTPMMSRPVFVTTAFNYTADQDPFRVGMNNLSSNVYNNATYTFEQGQLAIAARDAASGFAATASAKVNEVNAAAADVQAALAAIQAGPVASVNGKTGVITGLVETSIGATRNKSQLMANAPIGQWSAYSDTTGVGADWPPGHPTVNWWNVFTFGTSIATGRVTQRASQTLNTGYQGWIFERQLHDAAWSPWQRVLTDKTLIESTVGGSIATSNYVLNPANGSVHQMGVVASTTITLPAARTAGDQVTLCAHMQGSYTISLGANIALPIGASLPSVANGEMLMLVFTAKYDNTWYCSIAGKFPG